jgi:MaoC dehydratase-like protein
MAVERFVIEEGHIASFARSIGDANPAYYGAEAVAPPTFVQSSAQWDPDYFLRPKIGQPWFGSGREATGAAPRSGGGSGSGGGGSGGGGGTGLHAEQHYVYHRPLRAGDVLTAETKPGRSWEKEGRRAGKLVFGESVTEYRDQNGELVVTATAVGVRTERPVGG